MQVTETNAEGLEAAVDVSCTGAGVMMLELSYEASGQVEALSLVVPLAGTVDVAIPGSMSDGQGPVGLGPGRGVVWGNSEDDAGDYGRAAPGVLGHLFVGNGDRGFTILTDAGDGWKINDSRSMATIERDDQGRYTLNLHVINEPTTPKGKQQVRLAWVTHPSAPRPEDYRMRQWTTAFDAEPASPEPSLEALAAGDAVANLHGEAVALAPLAKRLALPGPTREQLGDHARDVVDLHAPGAYRYLTGTHTGLIRQVLPRNAQVTNPGGDPAPDRMLLARALLHDAGLDLSGLANATEAVELVSSLTELGFLEPGRVEVIPYWRSGSVLRYGPAFEQDDAFSLAVENPYRHVKITAYRVNGGKTAIIVVSNEGDEPVRDVLYLLDPERLLGGTNVLTGGAIIRKTVDFSKVPQDGDWRPDTLSASRGPALHDLETGSIVPAVVKRGAVAAVEYGRLFVAPHEFRVFVVSSDKSGN